MTTEYSIQKMVSDGTLSTIALGIQYLQRNDIYIRIAGEETPQSGAPSGYTWSFLDNTTLKILPVVPNGVEVVVYRRTDVDAMYNIYSQNAQFDEATVDENNQQLLYIAQEYLEQGIPGAGVESLEYINTVAGINYYRFRLTDGNLTPPFGVPDGTDALRTELTTPNSGIVISGISADTIATRTLYSLNILDFVGRDGGNGVKDCTAGMLLAEQTIRQKAAAGNVVELIWPAGIYNYTQSPNWAISRLSIRFTGEVWLINNGSGVSFLLDGGATGPGCYGLKITGFPLIYGGASSLDGIYQRAIHRSFFELECSGAGAAYAGLSQIGCVSNTVHFIMNYNAGGLYNTPAVGIRQTQRNANEETSYNLLVNPETSGMPIGIYQDGALGNILMGGAVQACTNKGLVQTPNAWNNKLYGTDFEANSADVECSARESQFFGCDFEKGLVFKAAALNCSLVGGVTENIAVEAGATNTLLSGVVYNRFGAGAINDQSTSTRYRDLRNKGTGAVHDKPRAKRNAVVTASPYTYTNTTANDQSVLITGGIVSQAVLTRLSGDIVPVSGMYRLGPQDSLTVTYTSAPAIVIYD